MAATHEDRNAQLSPGVAIKAPCRVATTAAITLSGEQTIDAVACVTGDRVLVKNQSDQTTNGIYLVSTGSWTREPDFDGNRDVVKGTFVFITNGTINAGSFYECTAANPVTFGSSPITFSPGALGPISTPVSIAQGGTGSATGSVSNLIFLQSGTGAVVRSMQDELQDKPIYAGQFGMSSSATAAQNTTAINAALAFAQTVIGQKTVVMPSGTLNINGFTPPGTSATSANTEGITLKGAGSGIAPQNNPSGQATILKFSAGITSGLGSTKTYGIYQDNTKHWCNFEDFGIDGNSAIDFGIRVTSQISVKRLGITGCNGAGWRGQTLDSTHMEDVVSIFNVGGGGLIDQATSQDSVNTTINTSSIFIGLICNNNAGIGLECQSLEGGKFIGGVIQSNTSFGLKARNLTGTAPMQLCDFDKVWFEGNGGGSDKYQILLDSADSASSSIPFANTFRGCRIDPLSTNKSIHIVKGYANRFTGEMFTNNATGAVDLDAGAVGNVFQACINSDASAFGSSITDAGTKNYIYSEWTTPAFSAGNFTSSAGTWVVGSGDVTTFEACVAEKTMSINFKIQTTTVTGTPGELQFKIPFGFTSSKDFEGLFKFSDNNGAWTVGSIFCTAGQTILRMLKGLPGAGNWSNSTDLTYVYGSVTFEVA